MTNILAVLSFVHFDMNHTAYYGRKWFRLLDNVPHNTKIKMAEKEVNLTSGVGVRGPGQPSVKEIHKKAFSES